MSAIFAAILSLSIIFLATTLGSALVFFLKRDLKPEISDAILGFASGIMLAAAIVGLLIPAMSEAKNIYGEKLQFLPVVVGFLIGGGILYLIDKLVPHLHIEENGQSEGLKSKLADKIKLFLAVTIHNIPEGVVVGIGCGMAIIDKSYLMSAIAIAIGIAIQNVPEGMAISTSMYSCGLSKGKSFVYGALSGIVEPIMGVIALFLVSIVQKSMPWFSAIGAGAMFYVTIDELFPNIRSSKNNHIGLWCFMFGFTVMLILEMVLA